jgi:starch synthase
MDKPLRILFATPEAIPYAKTGGLADVAGTLPKFLKELSSEVRIIMPYYRKVKESGLPLRYLGEEIEVPLGNEILRADLYQGQLNQDVPVYFIGRDEFFDREYFYKTIHLFFESRPHLLQAHRIFASCYSSP